jgi:hypothetical protein
MTSGENTVYAPVAEDTKELESSRIETATSYWSQNRNNHTSVQAAYGVHINDYRVEGSKHVSEGHVKD